MGGPVLGPRSLSARVVLFLIEKHFTFMFIKILLSVRYATHIKWFLKLFLELPWKEGLFEDVVIRAFFPFTPASPLHHRLLRSRAWPERTWQRSTEDSLPPKGYTLIWRIGNSKISVEGGSLPHSPSFVWLWHVEEFQPFIQQALIASFMFQARDTVGGAGRMQRNTSC